MSRKITIKFVRAEFEKEGWALITTAYVNSISKLDCICSKGHHRSISWSAWQQGNRCPVCSRNIKYTIEFIKSELEKEKWVCISTEYINAHSKLKYICTKGHRGLIRWNDWQQGCRCPVCSGKKKHTIEFVRLEFEKKGWVCLSKEYINSRSKLDCICQNGHPVAISWDGWKRGIGCPTCSGNKKLTIEFVKSEFEKNSYTCISKEYVNNRTKLEYICPKGHRGSATWDSWKQGKRCIVCAIADSMGSGNPSWKGGISKEPYCQNWTDDLRDYVKQRDSYKCINPYCNSENPHDLNVHHINYNKKLCGPENLITICRSCNAKANFDRDWHKVWYKAVLYRRYNIV